MRDHVRRVGERKSASIMLLDRMHVRKRAEVVESVAYTRFYVEEKRRR